MGLAKGIRNSTYTGKRNVTADSPLDQGRLEMHKLFHEASCDALHQTVLLDDQTSLMFLKADGQPDTPAVEKATAPEAGSLIDKVLLTAEIIETVKNEKTEIMKVEPESSCSQSDNCETADIPMEENATLTEDFAIEKIVGYRERRQYLVKWQGFSEEHNSWEDEDLIKGRPLDLQGEL